ncbi:MAG: ATP-binding cassette domain-containing protein [Actinomycetota bacterium]
MTEPSSPAIVADNLTKRYEPSGVDALSGVSFSVASGEVFGFLGRNGAGKSTTVRILTTLIQPTAGSGQVAGFDVVGQPGEVRRALGAALQAAALDELMTGREHLVLAGRLVGLPKAAAGERAGELLSAFGLVAAADRVAATYSGGMRRRLDVAMAMVRRPPVLFLDEPTTGLDPQGRRALWGLIADLRSEGAAVFLTTQYLAEADELADRVAIVHEGRIAALGTPRQLKDSAGSTTLRMRVAAASLATARQELASVAGAEVADDGWVTIDVAGGEATVPALLARLQGAGVQVERLSILPPTLEDVFVNLTGTEIESSAGAGESGSLSAARRNLGVVGRS